MTDTTATIKAGGNSTKAVPSETFSLFLMWLDRYFPGVTKQGQENTGDLRPESLPFGGVTIRNLLLQKSQRQKQARVICSARRGATSSK